MLYEIRRNQNAVGTQHAVNLPQCFLRVRHDVEGVGNNDSIKRTVRIGERHPVSDLELETGRIHPLFRLPDHSLRIVGRGHAFCGKGHMLRNQSRSGPDLQNRFIPDHFRNPVVHILIYFPVGPHR